VELESILKSAQGGAALKNLASAFGVSDEQVALAVQTMLQALSQRIERNTFSRAGLADLVALIGNPAAGRALNDPQALNSGSMAETGDRILNVLIGDKDTSRGIAQRAAKDSGIDELTLRRMLPVVASMMIGALQQGAGKALGDHLNSIPGLNISAGGSPLQLPGDEIPTSAPQRPVSNDLPRPQPGGQAGGGRMGGNPLPIPGDDIPGMDPTSRYPGLPDIVRRGGVQVPGPQGGSLEDVIRSILGGLLGFQNGGIMSWIVKLIFARWFWGFIQRILGRVLLGR
jgi:hypothetical protein